MKRRKIKIKWKNIILILIIITSSITLLISIFNIIKWKIDSNKTNYEITNIQENINVEEIQDTENTEIIEPIIEVPKENPYWDYINMNMINVDFNSLKRTNPDVGFIIPQIILNKTLFPEPFAPTKP